MSGIAAIVRFDGGEVVPGAIERLTSEMGYRGPDGITHWRRGPVAMGFCAFYSTTESETAALPLLSDDEQLVLVLDGYLFHLAELRGSLRARGARFRTTSDAEVVLRAYEQWGEACPEHLEGEYAFVLWDARRNAAFCARDHAGLRPLHFHWSGTQLTVASDPGAVLADPGVPQDPNMTILAEVAGNEWITRGQTVWTGIEKLLPATWTSFAKDGVRSNIYWSPLDQPRIRYARDEDYYDHYRALLEDCVRQSSRSNRPIACDVSGGLDSSAVFAVAEHLRRNGELLAAGVKGYTYRFDEGTEADEMTYARAVAAHLGVDIQEVDPFLPDLSWFVERSRADRDLGPYPNAAMAVSLSEARIRDGCRVALYGEGGDEWLGGRPYYYAQQLAEGDWRALGRSIKEDSSSIGVKQTAYRFARFGLLPFIPASIRSGAKALSFEKGLRNFDRPFWLGSETEQKLVDSRNSRDRSAVMAIGSRPNRSMYETLQDPFLELIRDQLNRQSARSGLEGRMPMFARRFIEFAFATPERLRLNGNQRKHMHVMALPDLLPGIVRSRRTKADFSLAFARLLGEAFETMAEDRSPATRDFVSDAGLERLFRLCQDRPWQSRPIWELWGTFSSTRMLHVEEPSERRER